MNSETHYVLDRPAIKGRAKMAFYANRWPSVGIGVIVSVLLALISMASSMITNAIMNNGIDPAYLPGNVVVESAPSLLPASPLTGLGEEPAMTEEEARLVLEQAIKMKRNLMKAIPVVVIFSFLSAVVVLPVQYFFLQLYNHKAVSVGEALGSLFQRFFRKLGGMLWMGLWLLLWSLVFYIPGVIKTYAYSMTPYILVDCPHITARQALRLSNRMTKGHKGEIFVMILSFIGWQILSAMTMGLLGFFFYAPYRETSLAGMYQELKEDAIRRGETAFQQPEAPKEENGPERL